MIAQNSVAAPTQPWLAIAGPTASGKSALSMALAAQLWAEGQPVEIISVDSALVYRGMDIGTAKPSAADRAAVPHHLIDTRDPLHAYSAADFVRDATRLMAEISARGALPLLVGGTMLYFKALRDGLDDLPAASATVRAALEARAAAEGWPTLHAELALHDPSTAQRLSPNDGQRIQRALEVWQITGRAISAFHATQSIANKDRIDCGYGSKNTLKNSPDHCLISLEPTDRTWLHQRIHQRFEAMLAQGLVDEVRKLRQRGDLHADLPSMRCVGYRQAWAFLDHADPAPQAMATLRETGLAATRQLAKRQLTWLRSMPERLVLPCDALSADAMLSHTLAAMRAWR